MLIFSNEREKLNVAILDENNLLSEAEKEAYLQLILLHGHKPHHFLIEVVEDQTSMDMNDLNYVIILKVRAIYLVGQKSRIYRSRAGSGTWLDEFEEDLLNEFFVSY